MQLNAAGSCVHLETYTHVTRSIAVRRPSEDRVCNGDQRAGDGDCDEFWRLAAHFEVLGDGLQIRILTGSGKCGVEQDIPN